jgi:hypothetical protein
MMRNGLYDFMLFLIENKITIYFMTWGDLSYGREIIMKMNEMNWKNSTEPRYESDRIITIPIENVFSRRNTTKKALPKHFKNAIPFYCNESITNCVGIDDDPGAWDVEVQGNVYAISRFSPFNNHTYHLIAAAHEVVYKLNTK